MPANSNHHDDAMPDTKTRHDIDRDRNDADLAPATGPHTTPRRSYATRLIHGASGLIRDLRSRPALSPTALREARREQAGGHPVDDEHLPHLRAAIDWLVRAQDATPDDGFARGYSLTWNQYFRARGWQPSYPETTGYIIPTLYEAAHHLGRPELADRATRAAIWSIEVQLPSGAVQGGVIGQGRSPAVFNTGQVILGWLGALAETGDTRFADAITRAGDFLVEAQGADGHWRRGTSTFANANATEYNTRVAWALAEAGARLDIPAFLDTAARNLRAVTRQQHPNGWFGQCCLTDPQRPLLHTLAYTIRGLLEGGRILEDEQILDAAESAAQHLLETVAPNGWMAGRYNADWSPATTWSCLTGEAQMVNNWIRLFEMSGDEKWLEPVPRVLRFLKSTQNRSSENPGLRGGIKGSAPIDGGYGTFEILNWATKFFADALMRHERILHAGGRHSEPRPAFRFA